MIVYGSHDDGTLYLESEVDINPITKLVEGYTRYKIPDTITLTANQFCGGYGSVIGILSNAGLLEPVID